MFEIQSKPCILVRCDNCEEALDEEYQVHYDDELQARQGAEYAGWIVSADGKVAFCSPECEILAVDGGGS